MMKELLDKTYRIDQLLGRGGMGAVYKAHDIALHRDVAIKVMHPYFTDDPEFRARFLQEARAIASLDHPGIVRVHAFGQDLELLYIVMDFIPGQTLHDWLKCLADERKIVALVESLAIVQETALALHYAHLKGVLHRDIKPANIMLKPADPALREPDDLPFHPVLTDFGLAKLAEGSVQTQTGTSMGTPAYMSPEQCLGLEMDHRTDIYSLGIVLFELITGRVPFQVKSLTEAIRRHTQEPPPPPRSINPTLPVEVENIALRTLAKRPEDRFTSAREVADALKAAIPRVPAGLTVAPTQVEGPKPYVSLMTRLAQESLAPAVPGIEQWEPAAPASEVGASLIVVSPDGQSRRFSLGQQRGLTVGRIEENDLQLDDPKVSRHHARIEFDGQTFTVTDLNSTNGTFLGESRLLPGVSQPWPPGVTLRIGDHWLKFEAQATPQATVGAPSLGLPERPSLVAHRAAVVLETEELTVEAGQRAVAQLHILNQGTQVDYLTVAVDGVPPTWVTLPKEPTRLTPNEEGVVTLTFHPPREPRSAAGPHQFGVQAISQNDPQQIARTGGTLSINPFHELTFEMSPQLITGRARLGLANRGNTPASLHISATDPAEALRIQATPTQLTLKAGEQQVVPLEATPKKGRPWLGATQRHPFEVTATPSVGQARKQGGTLIVKPLIPAWVLPVLGLLLMLICAGAGIGYKLHNDSLNATATADAESAIAAATRTATIDADGDGLTDLEEQKLGTNPRVADTDGDGLTDKQEQEHKTDPLDSDTDNDGLSDGDEIAHKTDPHAVDSDGDTLLDGHEVNVLHTSPTDQDTDGDGIKDNVDEHPGELPTHTPTPTPTPTSKPTPTPTHTPTPTPTATPKEPPDLVVTSVGVNMQGYTGGCVTGYDALLMTQICVKNQGAGSAGPFVVRAGSLNWEVDGLASGQERCLPELEGSASGQATVDADNEVVESDETNNTAWIAAPTPPPICTPPPPDVSVSLLYGGGVLEDVNVRKAILYAVPWTRVSDKVFGSPYIPFIAANLGGQKEIDLRDVEYDPDKAKERLEEGGYGGLELYLLFPSGDDSLAIVADEMVVWLADINITVELLEVPTTDLFEKMQTMSAAGLATLGLSRR